MIKRNLSINLSAINNSGSNTVSNVGNVEADEYEDMMGDPKLETDRFKRNTMKLNLEQSEVTDDDEEPDDELGSNLDEDLKAIGKLEDL